MHELFEATKLYNYTLANSTPEPPALKAVADDTRTRFGHKAVMLVCPLQGATLHMLVRITNSKRILELGTFTGYSALWMAEGLTDNGCGDKGHIWTVELDGKTAEFAQNNIEKSKHASRITLINKSGNDALQGLIEEGIEPFDMIFIDADKPGYEGYVRTILDHNLLAPEGFILADNVTFAGFVPFVDVETSKIPDDMVSNMTPEERKCVVSAEAMSSFNKYIQSESRLQAVMLPLFDGLHILKRRI
ncbi:S-adenosyl-L-methionine-dependent methyltransferase [Ramicandelaber brevisporus]|nr:S-adenosyl-L-methionine-dependent methyltransferase [Ramicandelaber brevisporus]